MTCEWTIEKHESGEEILTWWYLTESGNRAGREVAVLCDWNGKDDMFRDRDFLLNTLNAANRVEKLLPYGFKLQIDKPLTAFACNPDDDPSA